MNFVSFSPHFPHNYAHFCAALRGLGANVLGLADAPYESLHPSLRTVLTEYYRVPDMHFYDDLVRALGYFTHRYGKLDRIESHNEYWLETEARLRTDFNLRGLKAQDMPSVKRKSEMKKIFQRAGIPVARGQIVSTTAEAHALIDEIGLPVIAKPDIGVGASSTYKLISRADVDQFFFQKPPVDTILEEFISGDIESFDGLTDQDGRIVFCSSFHMVGGVMELVNEDLDTYYYIDRQIAPDVEDAGRKIVRAYRLRERFFHIEFFRTPDGRLVTLEANLRPPGGLTTDMFNYANDIDIYCEYADVVVNNRFSAQVTRPYYCAYVGHKWSKPYLHSRAEILQAFPRQIVHHEPISGVFSPALGNYGYIVRTPHLDELFGMIEFIQAKG